MAVALQPVAPLGSQLGELFSPNHALAGLPPSELPGPGRKRGTDDQGQGCKQGRPVQT